jgi:hypothetical protein
MRIWSVLVSGFALMITSSCDGPCDVAERLLEIANCNPDDRTEPGCIHTTPGQQLLNGRVLIITGIAGVKILGFEGCSDDDAPETRIDDIIDSLRVPLWKAQIWDWTQSGRFLNLCGDALVEPFEIGDDLKRRLFERNDTIEIARRLARRIREWQLSRGNQKLSLVCGSGGALIAQLASEARDLDGNYILREGTFHRVVLVSGAMSTARSIERLSKITDEGIFNYYSPVDATLQGEVCSPRSTFDYGWPAIGRFGYRPRDANFKHVAAQLGWKPEFASDEYKNDGRHMNAYRKEFFTELILPVLIGSGPVHDPWSPNLYRDHEDSLAQATFSVAVEGNDASIADTTTEGLVVIVPGHEGVDQEDGAAREIERQLGMTARVWDWSGFIGAERMSIAEAMTNENTAAAARLLAEELMDWRERNPTTGVSLLAGSVGTVVAILACEATDENGGRILPPNFFEKIVFVSGAHSTDRTLEAVADCSREGIFNSYSVKNCDLVGGCNPDCTVPQNSNSSEQANDKINGLILGGLPWPAAGRYGYRSTSENAQYVSFQFGWLETHRSLSDGAHMSEYDRRFLDSKIIPLFDSAVESLPEGWRESTESDYDDVDETDIDAIDFDGPCQAFIDAAFDAALDAIEQANVASHVTPES